MASDLENGSRLCNESCPAFYRREAILSSPGGLVTFVFVENDGSSVQLLRNVCRAGGKGVVWNGPCRVSDQELAEFRDGISAAFPKKEMWPLNL